MKFWFLFTQEKNENLELYQKRSVSNAYKRAMKIWKHGSLFVWRKLTQEIQQKTQKIQINKLFSIWIVLSNNEKRKRCRKDFLASTENAIRSKFNFENKKIIWKIWIKELDKLQKEKKVQNIRGKYISRRSLYLWIKKV